MKEVRVQVKLLNACDEALVRRELLTPDQVRACIVDAIVDTDLIISILPAQVVQRLGLATARKVCVQTPDGKERTADLTEIVTIDINGRHAVTEAVVAGAEVIIGRTVLARLDLKVDQETQQVIANPAHPDGPVFRV